MKTAVGCPGLKIDDGASVAAKIQGGGSLVLAGLSWGLPSPSP